ncbi:MAG: DUF748 domain-containing protein [Spirochaetaceae bacterium]|nr:DUF748 domain-containing protein [Spirochaetaceae bacterium]
MSEEPAPPRSPSKGSRTRRIGLAIALLALVYGVVTALVLPFWLRGVLEGVVREQTGGRVAIEALRFDPFRMRLAVRGFELAEAAPGAARIAFESLEIDVAPLGFLTADVALDEIRLVAPEVEATRRPSGGIDLVALLRGDDPDAAESAEGESGPEADADADADAEAEAEAEGEGEAWIVEVSRVRVERGRVRLRDATREPSLDLEIEPLSLQLDDLSTRVGRKSAYTLAATVGDATRIELEGRLGLTPLELIGHAAVEGVDLGFVARHAVPGLGVSVESGRLDVSARHAVSFDESLGVSIEDGTLDLTELVVVDPAGPRRILELPAVELRDAGVEVAGGGLREASLGRVGLRGGRVAVRREADGGIDLARLFAPAASATREAPGPASAAPASEPDPTDPSAPGPPSSEASGAPSPRLRLARLSVEDFAVDFEDRVPARPVALGLSQIGLRIDGFEQGPETRTEIELALEAQVGEGGRIEASGPLRLAPLETELGVRVSDVDLAPFEAYLEPAMRVELSKGRFGSELTLRIVEDATNAATDVFAKGRLQVDDLLALDRAGGARFVSWKRVRVEKFDLAPASLAIGEVGLEGVRARIAIDAEGRSNLDAIFAGEGDDGASRAPETAGPTASATGRPFALRIDRVVLDDVAGRFSDRSADFALSVDALGGTIEGLASDPAARATLALAGRIDEVAPIEVKGQLNPLAAKTFTDVDVIVRGVSMPPFSPYSGRYVGYRVDRGKLDLDLAYHVEDRKLEGENRIALRRFAFGDAVESETATTLPVPLAIALMRDPSGDIEIGLPIRGDLDDPGFDLLKLLAQAAIGLVTRVASTPFALVGGLVGAAGRDFEHVYFEPGRASFGAEEEADLETLATALAERPALRVEIRGRADPTVDGPALARERVEEAMRGVAFRRLSARERERVGDPSALELDDETRLDALERLHRERMGAGFEEATATGSAGGGGAGGDSSSARAAAIVEVLARGETLGESDWRGLARDRAMAVQAAFVERAGLPAERVFLVDPELGAVADEQGVPTQLGLTAR